MGRGHFSILQQNIHYFKEVVIALSKILLNESHIILRGQSKKNGGYCHLYHVQL